MHLSSSAVWCWRSVGVMLGRYPPRGRFVVGPGRWSPPGTAPPILLSVAQDVPGSRHQHCCRMIYIAGTKLRNLFSISP